jgi:hypothetical protein
LGANFADKAEQQFELRQRLALKGVTLAASHLRTHAQLTINRPDSSVFHLKQPIRWNNLRPIIILCSPPLLYIYG